MITTADELTPALPPVAAEPALVRAARRFIETNGFYILSALLMILGCYLLMRTGLAPGLEFHHTLRSLVILQAYELLVILSAVAIVRRFARLGDAMTLLGIELALLFDPTFFSNSLFTFISQRPGGVWVNLACFALVPLKLGLLLAALRLRLTRGMAAAFLLAAAFVYLGEGPLSRDDLPVSHAVYHLLLAWALVALAAVIPARSRLFTVTAADPRHITPGQARALSLLLLALPLINVATHFLESLHVHQIPTYLFLGTPLAIAVAVVALKNASRPFTALLVTDVCVVLALLFSASPLSLEGKTVVHEATLLPPLLEETRLLLAVAALASTALYLTAWLRLRQRAALGRVALLAAATVIDVLIRLGVAGHAAAQTRAAFGWMHAHPGVCFAGAALAALALALWRRRGLLALAAAQLLLLALAGLLPGGRAAWPVEITEALLLTLLLASHLLRSPVLASARDVMGFTLAILAAIRFHQDPTVVSGLAALGLATALLALGGLTRFWPHLFNGAALLLATAWIAWRASGLHLPLAVYVLASGLALFVAGLLVTCRKEAGPRRLTAPSAAAIAPGPGAEDR